MVAESGRVFVYGNFITKEDRDRNPPTPVGMFQNAVEILREFSATEFVGKIHVRTLGGNLQPVTPMGVGNYSWYQDYQRFLRDEKNMEKRLYFEAQHGDNWEVLYIRPESDASGGYVAVALKQEGFFWLRDSEFRTALIEPDKVLAFIPSDAEGNKRTGMMVRLHDEDAAKTAATWLATDRIFFYEFAHGRTIEIGYFNDRTKERIRIN